ncbi:MAG: fumarylacetoacetate hydrolase family protein [Gemmataceae bacterium]|nr:fumarylacetoacetate hydrolase family protein [Gemmataceae bacterium]MCI0740009.1 fumarylacetoacetate hydrolase family protein [Gemmataceae bacterium]
MRLCRYQHNGTVEVALYLEDRVVSINRVADELKIRIPTANSPNILDYLAPHGRSCKATQEVSDRFQKLPAADQRRLSRPLKEARLRVPLPDPKKVILLAGNYAAHIVEGGGQAVERDQTFPYFFWKPPTTALTDPGAPIKIPRVSPDHIDWEIELGVIIGRTARHVDEKEALSYVAGYTVCNDVSDRRMRINPKRKPRERDAFYDWLHGKWHDTFLPMGPCVRDAGSLPDPQKLRLVLKVNGKIMQDASTAQMIFPVAALISILSSFVTLEPGDTIVTGTPQGVGHARKPPIYLRPKDEVEAEIEGIGLLRNPVEAEK